MLSQGFAVGLLHVIDTGPRRDMDRLRERFFRPRAHHLPHEKEMLETEKALAQDILRAGQRYFAGAEMQREGRPEREIFNAAAEWQADLVVIYSRAEYGEKAHLGPRSVGHVA